jgi:hypothetical protein
MQGFKDGIIHKVVRACPITKEEQQRNNEI